jgi:acyl-coenzyme A synthetase/AMP-(fatty) acid ligase
MPGARFFPDARLNFAENLLRQKGAGPALIFRGEDKVARQMSHDELRSEVARASAALREAGVEIGDRVAADDAQICQESIAAGLAAASIGAVWSSCSPDFGEQGVLDRFGQIEPKVLDRLATATTTRARASTSPTSSRDRGQAADAARRHRRALSGSDEPWRRASTPA